MKKLKKVVSLLVVMVMALSLIPQTVLGAEYTAALESYFQGWGRWDNGVAPNGTTRYACVTDKVAHSGNNSLVIKHQQPDAGGMMVVQEGLSLTGTYTLSFWSIGLNSGKQIVVMQGQDGLWQGAALVGNATAAETDGDWTKYTVEFTVPEGKTQNALTLMSNGDTQCLYLDDISLVKNGTTENLIKNSGFEEKPFEATYTTAFENYFYGWEREAAIAENGSTIFTCVTDETAHSGNNSFVLKSLDTGDKDLMIKQTGLGLGEGTYTFSFWATGTVADWDNDSYRYQQIVWLEGLDPSY